jgi:hypothetical protein
MERSGPYGITLGRFKCSKQKQHIVSLGLKTKKFQPPQRYFHRKVGPNSQPEKISQNLLIKAILITELQKIFFLSAGERF